jgi:hypothetical protein
MIYQKHAKMTALGGRNVIAIQHDKVIVLS